MKLGIKRKINSWISAHIYFKGNIYESDCDKIILEVVEPFICKTKEQKLFEKYFFIRYVEFGSHIRLRFFGERRIITENIKPLFENFISNFKDQTLFTLPSNYQEKSYDSPLIWVSYEPELERYGGADAINIAEDFFYYSSETAIKLIKKIPYGEYSFRYGKGLLTTSIFLFCFFKNREKAIAFIKNYSTNYLKALVRNQELVTVLTKAFNYAFDNQSQTLIEYVNSIWECLENGETISEDLDEYYKCLIKVSEKLRMLTSKNMVYGYNNLNLNWENTLEFILPSYLHMMNNRLGISIKDESYLSHLVFKTLNFQVKTEAISANE